MAIGILFEIIFLNLTRMMTPLVSMIGNFVVADESGREEAAESGRKIGCIITQVLYHEQVRLLQKSPNWYKLILKSSLLLLHCVSAFLYKK